MPWVPDPNRTRRITYTKFLKIILQDFIKQISFNSDLKGNKFSLIMSRNISHQISVTLYKAQLSGFNATRESGFQALHNNRNRW